MGNGIYSLSELEKVISRRNFHEKEQEKSLARAKAKVERKLEIKGKHRIR
ncbi:hypothetical protein A2U01_0094173, partial [Trifolium medium]|nr:hypothetical protein [Trifolium medium]